jgi:hypothetical protein
MAADAHYSELCVLSLESLRLHSPKVPVHLTTCGAPPDLTRCALELGCQVRAIDPPRFLDGIASGEDRRVAWTRVAKLRALIECPFDPALYLDADTVAFSDVAELLGAALVDGPRRISLLLGRPRVPSVYGWRRSFLRSADPLQPFELADLLSRTFAVDLTVSDLPAIRCWNGGVVSGSRGALACLGRSWMRLYRRMLEAQDREGFLPNDQIALWLAGRQLQGELEFRDLPLAWNYMIAHVHGERAASLGLDDVLRLTPTACRILHLGDAKQAPWLGALSRHVRSRYRESAARGRDGWIE